MFRVFIILFFVLFLNLGNAKTLLENETSLWDIGATIKLGNLDSSVFENSGYQYVYVSMIYQEEIVNNLTAIFFIDYTYNSLLKNNYFYSSPDYYNDIHDNLGSLYLGLSSNDYGKIFYGKTQSVYYNSFIGSWFDVSALGGLEVINPNYNADILGTKNPENTIFYSNQFDNIKLSLQLSGGSSISWMDLNTQQQNKLSRDYGVGASLIYALGPLYTGISYLQSSLDEDYRGKYNFNITSFGANWDLLGIYSAFAIIYEENRYAKNTKGYGVSYLLSYDNNDDDLGFIPQITYGYKKYLDDNAGNPVAYNYLYTSLFYYISKNLAIFGDAKWDIRTANNVESTQYYYENNNINLQHVKENTFLFGIKYDLY